MRDALALASSLIAPPRCALCRAAGRAGAGACERCRGELSRLGPISAPPPPGLDAAWSAAPYRGAAQGLVRGLKFGRVLALASVAAKALAAAPAELLDGALVPVPAAPLRGRWRGFDSAEEIACELARRTGLPLNPCLRRSQGARQVGRTRAARLAAPPRVRAHGAVPNSAILVDDVLTTGATLTACARALRAAGSRRVVALTFARS
jgi:predicted amidophosphoribosyltransferase